MNAFGSVRGNASTPREKVDFGPASHQYMYNVERPCLSLNTVIGTTIDSGNGFDSLSKYNTYAVCAGSTVILSRIDEQLNAVQSFYRAEQNVTAQNPNDSFYSPNASNNSREGVRATASPYRDSSHGIGKLATYTDAFMESPGKSRASTRTRSASCISLSADGRLLAVGETGYNPRINIFGISDGGSDVPLTVLSEHSNFGVRSVAFSPDCRWLCSLGNVNDGFVFLWSISRNGAARLHSSNKCISNVQAIAWMGKSVISVGTRHVKVWRLERMLSASSNKSRGDLSRVVDAPSNSPSPKTLSGRNCLLGSLVDSTFTSVAALSNYKAVLCTENGDICLLDDTDQRQRLERVAIAPFKILCISVNTGRSLVLLGGEDGKTQVIPIEKLIENVSGHNSTGGSPASNQNTKVITETRLDICNNIIAAGFLRDHVVVVDEDHHIVFTKPDAIGEASTIDRYEKNIVAHKSAVLGISAMPRPNKQEADFMTWSSQGTALFWTLDGRCQHRLAVNLELPLASTNEEVNEMKVARMTRGDIFLFGDKNGNIGYTGKSTNLLRVHDGEVNDIAVAQQDDGLGLVASCGRDRTLQLFQLTDDSLEILQTLGNEHVGSVNSLMFSHKGSMLLSASADRTIVIRMIAFGKDQTAAFFPARTLNFKSSPIAFTTLDDDSDTLVVSTLDRQIHKYDLKTGNLRYTFKSTDAAKSESVLLNFIKLEEAQSAIHQSPILFGISSTDRSIRAYDSETGMLLARDYGQLGTSGCAIFHRTEENGNNSQFVVSTGLDGTIMIWGFSRYSDKSKNRSIADTSMCWKTTYSEPAQHAQPLRKILSKSELLQYQSPFDDSQAPFTPTRGQHPPRVRKKTSRLTLGGASKQSASDSSKSMHHSPSSPVSEAREHRIAQNPASSKRPPRVALASRTRRSSLDANVCSRRVGKIDETASPTEQLCQALRIYRERIALSSEVLALGMADQLQQELTFTAHTVRTKAEGSSEESANGVRPEVSMDGWLARMIDERLALKMGNAGSRNEELRDAEDQTFGSGGITKESAEH